MQLLQHNIEHLDIAFLGVQEGRQKGQQLRHLKDFFCFVAGATKAGTHGVELWVSKRAPVVIGGEEVYMKPAFFTVLHAEPTVLLVGATIKSFAVDLLVAHAPVAKKGKAAKRRWWQAFEALLCSGRDAARPLLAM
eukprot:8303436-Lingulodinium_polyedra.AAC.1